MLIFNNLDLSAIPSDWWTGYPYYFLFRSYQCVYKNFLLEMEPQAGRHKWDRKKVQKTPKCFINVVQYLYLDIGTYQRSSNGKGVHISI